MDCARHPERRVAHGVTLVELMVTLAVLGAMAGIAGLAAVPRLRASAAADPALAAIAAARRNAVASGASVRIQVANGDTTGWVLARPDGSVLGAAPFGFDALSGRIEDRGRAIP